MYYDYATQSYFGKAQANQLIREAKQARQAKEIRLHAEAKAVSKQKKVYFSSFGSISSVNTLVRRDI